VTHLANSGIKKKNKQKKPNKIPNGVFQLQTPNQTTCIISLTPSFFSCTDKSATKTILNPYHAKTLVNEKTALISVVDQYIHSCCEEKTKKDQKKTTTLVCCFQCILEMEIQIVFEGCKPGKEFGGRDGRISIHSLLWTCPRKLTTSRHS
jgi:hypothetical protein